MRFQPGGRESAGIWVPRQSQPMTAPAVVWLEHGIWNMPRVSLQGNVALLAWCSVFSLIKGMYLSKPVICRSATRTPCCYIVPHWFVLYWLRLRWQPHCGENGSVPNCPSTTKLLFFPLPLSGLHSYAPSLHLLLLVFLALLSFLFFLALKLAALHTRPHRHTHTRAHTPQPLVQIEWLYCRHCLAGTISPKQFLKWQLSNANKCLIYLFFLSSLSTAWLLGWKHELSIGTQSTAAIKKDKNKQKKRRFNQHLMTLSIKLTKVCVSLRCLVEAQF